MEQLGGSATERPLHPPARSDMFTRRVHALLTGGTLLVLATIITVLVAVDPTDSALQPIDDRWLQEVASHRTAWGTRIAKGVSFLGSGRVTVPLRLLVLVVLARRHRWLQLAAFVGATVSSELCIGPLKSLIDRPRPAGGLIMTTGASFPSGHAVAGAVTALGLVVILVPPSPRRWRWIGGAAALAALMAVSRTYLSVHWASDVVGGALIGTGLALVWPAGLEIARARRRAPLPLSNGRRDARTVERPRRSDEGDPMEPPTEDRAVAPPSRTRQAVQSLVSLVLVVAIFVFLLPQVADVSDVWRSIRAMSVAEMALLGAVAVWNILTYPFVWTSALPGLSYPQALVSSQASTAVANTVPGGSYLAIGITYTMLHSWGFRRSVVTLALLITGIWNNFAKLALPVLALAFLALEGRASPSRVVAGVAGVLALAAAIALFAMALRTEAAAARIGNGAAAVVSWCMRLLRRPAATGWDIAVTRFRDKTIDLLRAHWRLLTATTLVSHLSLFLVLLVAVRAVGVAQAEVSWAEVLAAFSFARLVTAIPLTPGGLGVVELALTGALVAAGGDRPDVVAAVLVYRALTFLPPIPVGVASYVYWRRNRRWRRPGASPTSAPVVAPAR